MFLRSTSLTAGIDSKIFTSPEPQVCEIVNQLIKTEKARQLVANNTIAVC